MIINAGATDQSVVIRIVDSTDGTPETGVVAATAGLSLVYWRQGESPAVGLTEVDLTDLDDAHTDGGILHVGGGYYRVDLPDAAFAAGADFVLLYGTVDDMVVMGMLVQLDAAAAAVQAAATAALTAYDVATVADLGGSSSDVNVTEWNGQTVPPLRNMTCWHKDI